MARHDLSCGSGSLNTSFFPYGAASRLIAICAIVAMPAIARAGQIIISWDRSPKTTTVGYRIYNAPVGQPFGSPIDVGNVSYHALGGLDTAIAYHAAVSAYDVLGQEGPLSAEVVYNPGVDGEPGGDIDLDGIPNFLETAGCTSPVDADTDDDGLADGVEDANRDGAQDLAETNPCVADSDDDGLQDGTELSTAAALVDTDPAVFRPDLDPATATDPLAADTDGDGLADGEEDSDANGRVDSGETDPLVADNPLIFADTFSDGTRSGDPSWKRVSGSWSVTGTAQRYMSALSPVNLALIADPKVRDFRSGRVESSFILSRYYTRAPNARIIFHYQDARHYRYLRLTGTGVFIGQVGSNPVEKAGVKASLRRRLKINTAYRLRIDIEGGTDVKVYLNGGTRPLLSHKFIVNSSGRVGLSTEGAKSLFDNVAVWTDFVLQ